MKKISVITVVNTINYGSSLQSYATLKVLESLGFDVEFVDYEGNVQSDSAVIKRRLASTNNVVKKVVWYLFLKKNRKAQRKQFRRFVTENLPISNVQYHSYQDLLNNVPKADIYCTGSDQAWNSDWNGGIVKSFFLEYAPIGAPRISLSTSIGKEKFDDFEENETIALLSKYDWITVREKSAEKLLRGYGLDATCVLDPTLLLTKDEWNNFSKKSNKSYNNEKYILVYQLHQQHAEGDFKQYVKVLSRKLGLPVYVISYGGIRKNKIGKDIEIPSVEEFINLFVNAEYVVTDSFHATAFSINLNKRFTAFMPTKFSVRLKNIMEICGLDNRTYTGMNKAPEDNEIDYDKSNERLIFERSKSILYLKTRLEEFL